MKSNKKVIESTIVALMLLVVITVTATGTDAQYHTDMAEEEVANVQNVHVETNGVAGVIGELASTQMAAAVNYKETASVAKTEKVTVAKAAATDAAETAVEEASTEEVTELTAEEQEWSSKLMANVEESLNIRSQADENSDIIGKLRRGDRAEITETLDGWYHIVSGSVDGYVKAEYCVTGIDALNFAKEICTLQANVLTNGLRLRMEPNETSEVYAASNTGDWLNVKTDVETAEGWTAVDYEGCTAYVKSEYIEVRLNYTAAITIEEEWAAIAAAEAKAAEEAAAKAAASAQSFASSVTQNTAVAASYDDITLLAALIQCEAGSEPYEGKVAVGAVVMNRVRSGSYPSSIYNVIYQSGQFTPAGSGSVASVAASGVSSSCLQAAQEAIAGADNTGGALSFRRASSGRSGVVIGNHVFF